MAVLGMIALFGYQADSSTNETAAAIDTSVLPPANSPAVVSQPLTPVGETSVLEPPNLVMLVDGENDDVVASLAPVVAPTRVELAIPAPRQVFVSQAAPARDAAPRATNPPAPAASPTPAAAPAPAPAPAATTQGS